MIKKEKAGINMLTVLNIEDKKPKNLVQAIKAIFRPYIINAEIRNAGGISVADISYIRKRGDIRFNKIYEYCIGSSKTILCDKNISLKGTPFRRFEGFELNKKLLENFICDILENSETDPAQLSISYYDPDADSPAFAERLLKYSSKLTVVSNMPRFYENESDRLLNEYGVSMIVSNSLDRLYPCDILIAPCKIKRPLPSVPSTPVFTVHRPLVAVPGNIITGYDIEIPEKYKPLKPDSTDKDYFLSGLYSLCAAHDIGALIPHSCKSDCRTFTKSDIIRLIGASVSRKN